MSIGSERQDQLNDKVSSTFTVAIVPKTLKFKNSQTIYIH